MLWLALMVSTTAQDFQGSLLPSGLWLHSCFCTSLAEPMMTEKLPQVVEAVQRLRSDSRIRVSWLGTESAVGVVMLLSAWTGLG